MVVAEGILWAVLIYFLLGTAVGVAFAWRGVERVDPAAKGTSWWFRLIILPGCVALWPIVLRLWVHARESAHS